MPMAARRAFTAAWLLLALLLGAAGAGAKTLYKLVDKQGRVSYVDEVPGKFDGEVTKLETDAPVVPVAAPQRASPAPADATQLVKEPEGARPDINQRRRAERERLQLALDRARDRLAAARKARDEGTEPLEGEYQVIQQRFEAKGNKPGPRPNCRKQSDSKGHASWVCATQVPGETYRDRQKELDDAVRAAEAEVEDAERAYRRGVD